jgi:hypothetical protein
MDYSYVISSSILSFFSRGFPGCYSASMKKGSKSTAVLWTRLGATRSRRRSSTRRRAFLGRKGKTSPLSRRTSTRSVSCLRWIAILWHVQVRAHVGAGLLSQA